MRDLFPGATTVRAAFLHEAGVHREGTPGIDMTLALMDSDSVGNAAPWGVVRGQEVRT